MLRNEKSSLNYFRFKMMKEESLNGLLGKQCKIVTKEPDNEKNNIVVGAIKKIEYDEKFIIVESIHGTGCRNMQSIGAIKTWQ